MLKKWNDQVYFSVRSISCSPFFHQPFFSFVSPLIAVFIAFILSETRGIYSLLFVYPPVRLKAVPVSVFTPPPPHTPTPYPTSINIPPFRTALSLSLFILLLRCFFNILGWAVALFPNTEEKLLSIASPFHLSTLFLVAFLSVSYLLFLPFLSLRRFFVPLSFLSCVFASLYFFHILFILTLRLLYFLRFSLLFFSTWRNLIPSRGLHC